MIRLLKQVYRFLRNLVRLNLIKTVYFNFRMLPIGSAFRFPFFLYGRISLQSLNGRVTLPEKVFPGMIRIGYRWLDLFPSSFLPSQINIKGEIVFKGRCIISGGCVLNVQSPSAILQIGDEVTIGGGSFVKSMDSIVIGDRTSITGTCTIMNSNMHYVKNIESGIIAKHWGKIIIGSGCWINSGSVVTKGAIIPDYSITSRNSFLSKDYSVFGTNCFLVGSPAVVKNTKVQRIFGLDLERRFSKFFRENPEETILQHKVGLEPDFGRKIDL